jgi:hypothetical protein
MAAAKVGASEDILGHKVDTERTIDDMMDLS